MVRKLLEWSVANQFIVVLLALGLSIGGGYAFLHVNVEAYPDPAPAIIEVVAQYPGASAEEVERLVTIPLEVALAGMPGLQYTRSKSLFGLAHLRNQFDYAKDYEQAKQEVINRLQLANLPAGVTPQISPASPTGEIYRYTLSNPVNALGKPIYSLYDLKTLQDYIIQRELLRIPRIAGVTAAGGMIKRFEVQPDPERLRQYGISLAQVQKVLGDSNANAGGDNLVQGQTNLVVRGMGLYGRGDDPIMAVLGMKDAETAAAFLRSEEARRLKEIRQTVIASVNNVPVRIDQIVDGGPLLNANGAAKVDDALLAQRGVIVSYQTRQGKATLSRPVHDAHDRDVHKPDGTQAWDDYEEKVQGIILLRKGEQSLPALHDVIAKIDELNQPGHLLPGVHMEMYYNRTDLINLTTETVHENLLVGMCLVSVILLMFLNNIRVAIIVALNIPLALMFAFGVLFLRGKSANLLSIGAVDFGIIVDSAVILVESIYRHLTHGEFADLPFEQRVIKACAVVERSIFFATLVMVCALLPLFTMKGPEGQIFGPMADTYAFALGGALLLAMTISPVLCCIFLRNVKPTRDNFLVRGLEAFYLGQLRFLLKVRWIAFAGFCVLVVLTGWEASRMGREFMPELEEGNVFIRGTFPINMSFQEVVARNREVRRILRNFPEIEVIVPMIGRPDDGTDPTGFSNVEIFVPLRPDKEWPTPPGRKKPRTKPELIAEMNGELDRQFPGVDWDFSQIIRDNVMEALSGVKGENSVKIFGPDLDKLEELAEKVKSALNEVRGVVHAGVFRIQGQSNLEIPIDREKCALWGVSIADVQSTIQAAVGGRATTQMTEGGMTYDITVRYPERLRNNVQAILDIPVDIANNQVTPLGPQTQNATSVTGASTGPSSTGASLALPAVTGSQFNAPNIPNLVPQRRLGDLVSPYLQGGSDGQFIRPGASTIYREQGQRLIAIKFGVSGRDLAGTVEEAKAKVQPLIHLPYRDEWSGEFQEMEEAEARLAKVFGLSLALIVVLLYLAFRSLLDTAVVLANVVAMGMGGVWALELAGLNFNISAAVGFISILGVAVMNGLLLVSAFNRHRSHGKPVNEAVILGTAQVIRPATMTALTAILGLLPAAFSTRIGAQSQRPLAIVVVGGMLTTLIFRNLAPMLYSFYGRREPNAAASDMGH